MLHASQLGIRSPAGIAHEVNNEMAWRVMMEHFVGTTRQSLHDRHPADGILRAANSNRPVKLIEVKSRRDFDEQTFWEYHRGTWLISNHKILHNVPIARSMGVPFIGAMHIIESRLVLLKTIWENDVLASGIEVRKCKTRANINGGTKIIDNAFIPMHDAVKLRY